MENYIFKIFKKSYAANFSPIKATFTVRRERGNTAGIGIRQFISLNLACKTGSLAKQHYVTFCPDIKLIE
jgi:hypothetical protein